jgi:hypothetical protein
MPTCPVRLKVFLEIGLLNAILASPFSPWRIELNQHAISRKILHPAHGARFFSSFDLFVIPPPRIQPSWAFILNILLINPRLRLSVQHKNKSWYKSDDCRNHE